MLAIVIGRAKNDGHVGGIILRLVDDGLSILQYADDTISFMDHNFDQAKKLKLILCTFEQLSSLKTNFHKNELFCFGEAKKFESQYLEIFGCERGCFPFKYLGIPIHFRRLRNNELTGLEDRFEKRLSNWKRKKFIYWWKTGTYKFGFEQSSYVYTFFL